MKLLLAIPLMLALAAPAMAWDTGATTTANATQHQHQTAKGGAGGAGGSATATGGYVTVLGGASGHSSHAPDVVLPSFGGGGMDCPTVGFGAGGSGLGGGGGFGPSWISSDCNKRKVAELLYGLYGSETARAYVEANIPGVKEAVDGTAPPRPIYAYPAWCRASDGVWLRDLPECMRVP